MNSSIYNFSVKDSAGKDFPIEDLKGQVILVVNVASKCGFTPQYEGLEKLYQTYKEQGFMILGFPCNQFGGQEPGTSDEIQNFCKLNYGVSFPIMQKIDVNGQGADPLFKHLKSHGKGLLGSEAIKWNFTKFLIDRQGQVVKRFAPNTPPGDIAADINKQLAIC